MEIKSKIIILVTAITGLVLGAAFFTSNNSAANVSPRMSRGDRIALEEAQSYVENHHVLKSDRLVEGVSTTDGGNEILVCGEERCLCTGKKSCKQMMAICGDPQYDGLGLVKCTK